MKIFIIDGQGGGIGKSVAEALTKRGITEGVFAAGLNKFAAATIRCAGVKNVGCGDKAVVEGAKTADVIIGPIGIVIAGALKGEVSAETAQKVAESNAVKLLIPLNKCNILVAGVVEGTVADKINDAVNAVEKILSQA